MQPQSPGSGLSLFVCISCLSFTSVCLWDGANTDSEDTEGSWVSYSLQTGSASKLELNH